MKEPKSLAELDAERAASLRDGNRNDQPRRDVERVNTPGMNTPAKPAGPSISVTFTGDPSGKSNPENPSYDGINFPLNKAVTVSDQGWISRNGANLRKNNHFAVT